MTTKTQDDGKSKLVVPRLTLDPALPQDLRDLLRSAEPHQLHRSPEDITPWKGIFAPVRKETGVVGLAWLMTWSGSKSDVFAPYQWSSLGLGGTIVVVWAAGSVLERRSQRDRLRRMRDARAQYVMETDLSEDAGQLLARAGTAANAVLRSAVHKQDLIDRQRNEVALPQQQWEIAETLREYSRLVKAAPVKAEGDKVTALLDTRRRALQASLDGITRRVVALEGYAAQVAEADRQYRELQQIQALTAGGSDVLDLLARTARDDLAVAEIEGMTGEAAAVADAFTTALESAKEAAVIALPTRTTAA
ncbi:hypothetical protein [Streptomyces sp. NPDC091383]|uniref:hypothetical protein n=1 Tax=Streptomyces sp. NPDC091383 TaxID=3365996 RepID=UPI003804015F